MSSQGPPCVLAVQFLISGLLWVLGSLYAFVVLLIALLLSYLLPFRVIDPFLKALARGLFRILFTRVEVQGLQHVDPDRTVIYLPNHSSMLDVPLVAGFVPGYVRGIEASGQLEWPLYGWAMRRLGNLPIDRDDVHTSISTMRRAARHLESVGSLIIFPEGHRTTTGQVLPFKKLPFHLARESGKPLIPVAIGGMFEINNKTSWMVRPGRVVMRFGEEISEEEVSRLSAMELRELAEERIRDELAAIQGPPAGHET